MTPNLFSSKGLSLFKARPFLETARAERQRNEIIPGIQLPLQKPLLSKDLDIFESFRGILGVCNRNLNSICCVLFSSGLEIAFLACALRSRIKF